MRAGGYSSFCDALVEMASSDPLANFIGVAAARADKEKRDAARLSLIVSGGGDPRVISASKLVVYGLSGAPPTEAHLTILLLLAKYYRSKDTSAKLLLVPSSNLHTKDSVRCIAPYNTPDGINFRVLLLLELALLAHEELEKTGGSNIIVSLHEQNKPAVTYDSIIELTAWGKPIQIIWGADSVKDILTRRWAKAKLLGGLLNEGKVLASFLSRDGIPHSSLASLAMGPVHDPVATKQSLYGPESSESRTPYTADEAAKLVSHIEDMAGVLSAEEFGKADGVSSSDARVTLAAAWELTKSAEPFKTLLFKVPPPSLPVPRTVLSLLANWQSYCGPMQNPPWSDVAACSETKGKDLEKLPVKITELTPLKGGFRRNRRQSKNNRKQKTRNNRKQKTRNNRRSRNNRN